MQTTSNVIDKNWKALIKPNKLDITSNDDKTIAKVIAEPLEKGFGQTIGNSLISASQAIEKLRSEKTNFHGKTDDDFLINDTIYAYFIVNTVTTIGLFIKKFYLTKYPKENIKIDTSNSENDLPF